MYPAIFALPPTPNPPETVNAPVVIDDDGVVDEIIISPENVPVVPDTVPPITFPENDVADNVLENVPVVPEKPPESVIAVREMLGFNVKLFELFVKFPEAVIFTRLSTYNFVVACPFAIGVATLSVDENVPVVLEKAPVKLMDEFIVMLFPVFVRFPEAVVINPSTYCLDVT